VKHDTVNADVLSHAVQGEKTRFPVFHAPAPGKKQHEKTKREVYHVSHTQNSLSDKQHAQAYANS
jgi:hypothetical protein